ncbi:MAG: hypothetical protein ACYTGF_01385 [Planctomycetota bacterium]|jgi:hypothetical protein
MNYCCARRRTTPGWVAVVGFAIGSGAIAAHAEVPELQINWSIGEGPINQELPAGNGNGDGTFTYEGLIVDDGTGLELSYSLTTNPSVELNGNVSLENDLQETIGVSVEVILPKPDPLPEGSLLAGLVVVGLTTGPGGGQLSSQPPWLWQALGDGNVVGPSASLFADPFYVANSGPANAAASADFGTPDPVPGPPIIASFGFRLNFTLTSFDVASITSVFTTTGALGTCAGDIDGDGVVGIADLGDMIAAWGPCPGGPEPCPSDLDGNGQVGITDFLELLSLWGPCP